MLEGLTQKQEEKIVEINEKCRYMCCVPMDDKADNLLNSKAKELLKKTNKEEEYYGFYINNVFYRKNKIYAKVSLIDPYDRDKVFDNCTFDVLWEDIKDSEFVNF